MEKENSREIVTLAGNPGTRLINAGAINPIRVNSNREKGGTAAREMDWRMVKGKAAKAEINLGGMQMGTMEAAANIGTGINGALSRAKAARDSKRGRCTSGTIRHHRMHNRRKMDGRDLSGRS
jgi:hypothetical protein